MIQLPLNFELDRYGLHCRLVNEDDAEFIVELRSDPKLRRFIHASDGDVKKQIEWTREYKKREAEGLEYYFIYEFEGTPIGLNRIYNREENRATTGSWVVTPFLPLNIMFATLLIEREIYFDILNYEVDYIDVRKENKQVWHLHRRLGAIQYGETELDYLFIVNRDDFHNKVTKFKKLLNIS